MADTDDTPAINGIITDPVSRETINAIGITYLIVTPLLFYVLIAAWPVQIPPGSDQIAGFKEFNLFSIPCRWAPDKQLLFLVLVAGAIGSLTHALTSFGDFVGNKKLGASWIWWLLLRIPIGAALALLFYFIIRGGLLLPALPNSPLADAYKITLTLNPYGITAFAALAGMFSKQATDKFAEVFASLFAVKNPVDRKGALDAVAFEVKPAQLKKGKPEKLSVQGEGFTEATTATIDGKSRDFKKTGDKAGTVETIAEDVDKLKDIELVLKNADGKEFRKKIKVVEDAASPSPRPPKPQIMSVAPAPLPVGFAGPLKVSGDSFQSGCTATLGGAERKVSFVDAKTVEIATDVTDVAAAKKLALVVTNKGGDPSNAFDVTVQ